MSGAVLLPIKMESGNIVYFAMEGKRAIATLHPGCDLCQLEPERVVQLLKDYTTAGRILEDKGFFVTC